MAVVAFAAASMQLLAPGRDHTALSTAVAKRVEAEAPLFKEDDDKRRTTAYLVAIAFRESSFKVDAIGDKGRSFCAFQIHETAGGTKALLTDVDACVGKAFAMLRMSMRLCPAFPLAWYAAGPNGCGNDRAQRISRDRMAIAARLLREVK